MARYLNDRITVNGRHGELEEYGYVYHLYMISRLRDSQWGHADE
jgi:hypothetical protein